MNANDIQSVCTRSCRFMSARLIYPSCVCVCLSAGPMLTANVLRGLSSPSPHRLEQAGTENFPGVC